MVVVFDLVENILTRLTVKDLLRCKSVCKSWYSLISSTYFVNSHLKHNICNNNNDSGHTRIAMPTFWKIPNNHENLYQRNRWELIGSSNGLVCVSIFPSLEDGYKLLVVINPLTREVRELPVPPLLSKELPRSPGFGYDSSTDDYKVVMLIDQEEEEVDESPVLVFSLKSMTWKRTGHIFKHRLSLGSLLESGVLINRALHWLAIDYKTEERRLVILSFELSQEEFKVIPLPDDHSVGEYSKLGVFENNLCISSVCSFHSYYGDGLWVMRNYKVKQSWEFFPSDYEMNSHDFVHYMKIYDCTAPKKNRMTFFCDDKACLSRFGNHIILSPIFVQSLVSPYVNSERPSHAGSAKVAERERQEMHTFEIENKRQPKWDDDLGNFELQYNLEGGDNEKSYLREH